MINEEIQSAGGDGAKVKRCASCGQKSYVLEPANSMTYCANCLVHPLQVYLDAGWRLLQASDYVDSTAAANDGFTDYLPVESEYIAPGEYKIVSKDGDSLFYVEGAAFAEWVCEVINREIDETIIGLAKSEGLRVWKEDAEDYGAIRESLPSISGFGLTPTEALMHLAAGATLAFESLNSSLAATLAENKELREQLEDESISLYECDECNAIYEDTDAATDCHASTITYHLHDDVKVLLSKQLAIQRKLSASLDETAENYAKAKAETATIKEVAEHGYIEAEGDAALRHINIHKWELDTAIRVRQERITSLEAERDALRTERRKIHLLVAGTDGEGDGTKVLDLAPYVESFMREGNELRTLVADAQRQAKEFAIATINEMHFMPLKDGPLEGWFNFMPGRNHKAASSFLCEQGFLEKHSKYPDWYRFLPEPKSAEGEG